jgi:hypothetical protein
MNEYISDFVPVKTLRQKALSRSKPVGKVRQRLIRSIAEEKTRVRNAQIAVRELERLVTDRRAGAAHAFAGLTISMVRKLNQAAMANPELIKPFARMCFSWPVLKARKERFSQSHEAIIETLDVGAQTPFSGEALERIRTDNVPVRIAMDLLCQIQSCRGPFGLLPSRFRSDQIPEWATAASKLDDFSPSTCRAWFAVAWQIIIDENNGAPELDPELEKLGIYREQHSVYVEAQKKATLKTRQSNIRDGIKSKLKAAFNRIASFPTKRKKN